MDKKNILTILGLGAGAYAVYWYLTNYGPHGAVNNAQGVKIAPSYWDGWFGGLVAPTNAMAPMQPAVGGTVNQFPSVFVQPQLPAPAQAQVPLTPSQIPAAGGGAAVVSVPSLRDKLAVAAGGTSGLNADQWNYYYNQLRGAPLTAEQFTAAFPGLTDTDRGPAMTIDQFISAIRNAGLGDIVPTLSMPSMSFGTGAFGGAFRGPWSGGRKGYA